MVKVINYTALKKIEDSIYKQKAAEKSLKPSSRSIKFKRYSNFFCGESNQLYSIKKNRGQHLQAKSRRKKPQTQFQKHQIQEIFEFFLLIVEV